MHDNTEHYRQLEEEIQSLLCRLGDRLPNKDTVIAGEYIAKGEYGVALEHICDQLYEYSISISPDIEASIRGIAAKMKIGERISFIRELVKDSSS